MAQNETIAFSRLEAAFGSKMPEPELCQEQHPVLLKLLKSGGALPAQAGGARAISPALYALRATVEQCALLGKDPLVESVRLVASVPFPQEPLEYDAEQD